MAQLGNYDLLNALNECMPVARRAQLGVWMFAMEKAVTSLLAQSDVGAAVDAGATYGTGTLTVAGTITNGDSFRVTLVNPSIPAMVTPGLVVGSIAVVTADTVTTIATKLTAALNGNATLTNNGYVASSSAGVVTLKAPGTGSATTLTAQLSPGATETVTPVNVTAGTGGAVVARASVITPIPLVANR
jgi:hypothetical protein